MAMYNPYLAKQELKAQMKRQKFMAKYGMMMGMPGYGGYGRYGGMGGMRYGMRPPGMGGMTPSMQTRPGMPASDSAARIGRCGIATRGARSGDGQLDPNEGTFNPAPSRS